MYRLDKSKAETLQINNDAFYYIKDGEEPIDENSIEEADEIYEMFPNGFEIQGDWQAVDNTGMIEATFIPYVIDECEYDMYCELAEGYILRLKLCNDKRHIKLWSFTESTGAICYKGEYELRLSQLAKTRSIGFSTGNWRNGQGCLFWLKQFKEIRPTTHNIVKDLNAGL